MADNKHNVITDLKSLFGILRTRRTKAFAYGFMFAFLACTVFIAFNPNVFYFFPNSGENSNQKENEFSSEITKNQRNQTQIDLDNPVPDQQRNGSMKNGTIGVLENHKNGTIGVLENQKNGTKEVSETPKNGTKEVSETPKNGTKEISETQKNGTKEVSEAQKNGTKEVSETQKNGTKEVSETQKNGTVGVIESQRNPTVSENQRNKTTKVSENQRNKTAKVSENQTGAVSENQTNKTVSENPKRENSLLNSLKDCDIFDGKWVKDDSYPLYSEGSCPYIDEPFDCFLNGRSDRMYQKLRWQPNGCNIPRLNGTDMLERLRGKRLVFVGDSLNRNMWESMVCVLRNSVKDKSKVFEASGRREFRTVGSYSFIFKDYDCSVEFFRSPFLVQELEIPEPNGTVKETLRLDLVDKHSPKYKNADIIVFNTGHWWTHEKTSKGKDYYQEGSHVYGELKVIEAFRRALTTWARWVDANVNPNKTHVFFRGYSASHFSGGQWNSGGQCNRETEPIKNETYLASYPPKMNVLESVMKGMKTRISYLNITRITDYRKDAHPSIYRKQNLTEDERRSPERYQDCSHWCLPGVPDTWNELLYAQLIIKQQ
ncbi:protein trichome birefringence-like 1 isoform X2 [Tasmannia lanceolata]|uniref:protein trichome birefringence-like 1 isoform X2 n=1 Tax=Tasmannia lanceolata TaxID=3420 RepID=UPI004062CE5C